MVGAEFPLFVRVIVDSGGAPVSPPRAINALHVKLAAESVWEVAVVGILGEIVPPVRIEFRSESIRERCWDASRRFEA